MKRLTKTATISELIHNTTNKQNLEDIGYYLSLRTGCSDRAVLNGNIDAITSTVVKYNCGEDVVTVSNEVSIKTPEAAIFTKSPVSHKISRLIHHINTPNRWSFKN